MQIKHLGCGQRLRHVIIIDGRCDSMFKIAKLENVKNEVVSIEYATQEQSKYEDGKKYHTNHLGL